MVHAGLELAGRALDAWAQWAWLVSVAARTVRYWVQHSLPVILVLADLDARTCFWERVDTLEVEANSEAITIRIPKSQLLGRESRTELDHMARYPEPWSRVYEILERDRGFMQAAAEGLSVAVDVQKWVNKSPRREPAN